MSGYQRPRPPRFAGVLRLPRASSVGSVVQAHNDAATALEIADTQNVKRGLEPAFPSILLTAQDGSTWRVRVTVAGGVASLTIEPER